VNQEQKAIEYYKDSVLTKWENCPGVPLIEKANTTYNIGLSYQYLGEYDLAKTYLDDALTTYENIPNYSPLELAKKYHSISTFYLDSHDFSRAELYYKNALNIYRNYSETEIQRFDILNNLIVLCSDLKKSEYVNKYFDQALTLYRLFPQSISNSELSMVYLNTGAALWGSKDFDGAMQKSKIALSLIDKEDNPLYYAVALEVMALIHDERGQREEALNILKEVVSLRLKNLSNTDDYVGVAAAYENIAEIYLEQGKFSEAEDYLKMLLTPSSQQDLMIKIISLSSVKKQRPEKTSI